MITGHGVVIARDRVVVTDADRARLAEMIRDVRTVGNPFRGHVRELEDVVRRARIVAAAEVEPDVVTMNSRVSVRDADSGRAECLTLVYHRESGMFDGRLSVLTPLGTRALGARAGDAVEWSVPRGARRRLTIERIMYQPEAAGDYDR